MGRGLAFLCVRAAAVRVTTPRRVIREVRCFCSFVRLLSSRVDRAQAEASGKCNRHSHRTLPPTHPLSVCARSSRNRRTHHPTPTKCPASYTCHPSCRGSTTRALRSICIHQCDGARSRSSAREHLASCKQNIGLGVHLLPLQLTIALSLAIVIVQFRKPVGSSRARCVCVEMAGALLVTEAQRGVYAKE